MLTIAIIGGGASGMAAAIAAKRQNSSASVIIFEHKDIPGKKILSTGNGRCNLTNEYMDMSCFRSDHPKKIAPVLERFTANDTIQFFHELGILTKSRNGYIYPRSDQASAVLSVLRMELKRLGVEVIVNTHVKDISATKKGFRIFTEEKNYLADKVILSTGSKAAKVLGSDGSGYIFAKSFGHKLTPVVPALVQLKVKNFPFTKASGVRADACVKAIVDGKETASDTGELQITAYGISGIPVFQISRYIAKALYNKKRAEVSVDFIPQMSEAELIDFLIARKDVMKHVDAGEFLIGIFNQKLIPVLLGLSGIRTNTKTDNLSIEQLTKLVKYCKNTLLTISDTNGFDNAQICAGGVSLNEIKIETMESCYQNGLYITGELLDVDGICGGYNLQWAWATGIIAGQCAARQE